MKLLVAKGETFTKVRAKRKEMHFAELSYTSKARSCFAFAKRFKALVSAAGTISNSTSFFQHHIVQIISQAVFGFPHTALFLMKLYKDCMLRVFHVWL